MGGRVDYERVGRGHALQRREDPRFAARIHAALGEAETVVNVGAGAGAWDAAHGHLRELYEIDGSLRLIVSEP